VSQSVSPVRDESQAYQCVRCHSGLERREQNGLQCVTCGSFYPSIEGVRILVSDPDHLLRKHAEWLPERKQEIETRQTNAIAAFDEKFNRSETLDLVQKGYDGLLANVALVEKHMAPVKQYLAGRTQPPSIFNELEDSGWPATEMMEYFYRDWSGAKEGEALDRLLTDAAERFCPEKKSVAVLGCGACGLVRKLRDVFPLTYGVDLAVDTLLLAKGLLDGKKLNLHFNTPNHSYPVSQNVVTIEGAKQKRQGITLLAANVNQLPFATSSLSCVITQYMMDIVPSQRSMAAEINRVLADDGVWIDFSLPLAMSGEDQFNSLGLPVFLEHSGFKLLDKSMHRVDVLDMTSLSEWAWSSRQTPILFAARKVSEPAVSRHDHFADYFAKKSEEIWNKVPKRVVDISLVNERRFTDNGINETKAVRILRPNNPRARTSAISDQTAAMTEWFLRTVDGARTIKDIFDLMRRDFGPNIPPDDVLQFFSGLEESHLIEIR
jgi:SAM-dependent methyltransferase